jgi:hypothetical protein
MRWDEKMAIMQHLFSALRQQTRLAVLTGVLVAAPSSSWAYTVTPSRPRSGGTFRVWHE